MAKYGNWTLGDIEALINVLGGDEAARAIKNRTVRFTIEQPKPPARPPLVGRVVKTIIIPAYQAKNFADAVRLGKFDNQDGLGDLTRQFSQEQVGLAKSVKIDLVEFDRNWWNDEAVAWGVENGNKKPIEAAHTLGIAIKLPNEQRDRPIVGLGSVQGGDVLCLGGDSGWRSLSRGAVEDGWARGCLVGFLSE